MENLEVSAKTVEEAIQKALEQLGLPQDKVEVTILKKGKPGFLGLGGEEAKVMVRPLQQPQYGGEEPTQAAKEALEHLLSLMGMAAEVEISSPPSDSPTPPTLNIKGEELGILIGRRGQTLASLQYMVNLITSHRLKAWVGLDIDVDGYKQRRSQSLKALASRLAQKVTSTGQAITLEPMPSNERRIVHLALANHPSVITQSIGDEEARKIVILPKPQEYP